MFNIVISSQAQPGMGPKVELYGPWVTERVHEKVSMIMNDNWTNSPIYQAKRKCNAFFQGGSNRPDGEWILLEFWSDVSETEEFMAILNQQLVGVIPTALTKIAIHPSRIDGGLLTLTMIAEDTKCILNSGDAFSPCYFHPENNKQFMDVANLIRSFGGQLNF